MQSKPCARSSVWHKKTHFVTRDPPSVTLTRGVTVRVFLEFTHNHITSHNHGSRFTIHGFVM